LPDPMLVEKKLGMVVHTCHPSNGRKHKLGRLWSKPGWAKSETLSQINQRKQKGAGGVAQVVTHLLCKCLPAL
jgi:hypothetical protein